MTLAVAVAFIVALGLVRFLASGATSAIALDRPNERSLHERPTPRLGGLGLLAGVATGWIAARNGIAALLAVPLVLLVAVSLADDLVDMPALARFLVQVLAALVFLVTASAAPWGLWPLLVIAIVWSANLFNFMDGSDGLAGGMALAGFATYAIVAALAGQSDLAIAAASVAAAAAGFLVWNFHPARIFMGDSGSVPIGFLAAALGILGVERGAWSFWLPALVFSPFLFDATVTLVRRFLRGEKVWQAHRTHYYQRVVRMGAGHRTTALGAYLIMGLAGTAAILARSATLWSGVLLCLAWLAGYGLLARRIDAAWSAHEQASGGGPEAGQQRQP